MGKDFNLLLAENRRKMGEEAAARGSDNAARANFKISAESYRKVAASDISNRQKWLNLAEEMQNLADGASLSDYRPEAPEQNQAPQKAQNTQNTQNTQKASDTAKKPTVEKNTQIDETELTEALGALNELIGLSEVKTKINDWVDQIRVFKIREERGLPVPPITYHMVFTGNPGTGKTTVARLIAKIYHALGIIREDKCKEVGREDMVAGFVGQTAIKTKEVIDEALGGILFIDEAYTLKKEGNDFGQEAIDTLLKVMEDQRDEIAVIAAGYEEDMKKFINANAGLSSRFKNFIDFADYNGDDLYKIFTMNCKKRKYVVSDEAKQIVKEHFKALYANRDAKFGNARDVRNFFESVVTKQAVRLSKMPNVTDQELCTILPEDMEGLICTKSGKKGGGESLESSIVNLCVQLEGVLKNKFKFDGDLFNMVESLKGVIDERQVGLLHKLRMKRNNLVHAESGEVTFTENDFYACAVIIDRLEKMPFTPTEVGSTKNPNERPDGDDGENYFSYHGGAYEFPPLSLLKDGENGYEIREENKQDIEEIIKVLISKLADFDIKVELDGYIIGASYSRVELRLVSNTQLTVIAKYEADIAMVLKRKIRLLLPIEGKDLIGVEVQNKRREVLTLKSMLSSPEGMAKSGKMNTGIGYDIDGKPVFVTFDSLPHALVGGSAGSGKSVFLSSVIMGLIYRYHPQDVRLVLIDFKRVEMNIYNGLPYIVGGRAIDEFEDTVEMFDRLTEEMERRYALLSKTRTRNFKEYNEKVPENERIPVIVTIIDEFADMITNRGYKDLEKNIQKIAQKARAAGMYMIIATQRPSAKVIDGVIKANLPSRIAFTVASHIDSMNILDASGAEDLIGAGDMLFQTGGYIKRLQAPYISTQEIGDVVDYILK